ncbi:MAG: GIY-YIG nuclease family protein [Saccharofermentans sp.]|nr:GIY-YIG nuclease family protein [Saccharofermentans sp.]
MGQAKVINIVLENGTLDGVVRISNKAGEDVIILSAPRKSVDYIFEVEESQNFGVYLLLSEKQVYVGQSSNLKSRIKNHLAQKEWWNRVVLMTTRGNKFNSSDIDYLESVLINKAHSNHSLDTENKKAGNKHNIERGDQISLDSYIEEAMFLLDFIGVGVFGNFKKDDSKQRIQLVSQNVLNLVQRSNAIKFLQENKYIGKEYSYAKRDNKYNIFAIDPQFTKLDQDWILVLNDIFSYRFILLSIPQGSFTTEDKDKFRHRKDDYNKLTMKINGETLIEKNSGFDFSKYVKEIIPYEA